MLLARVTGTVVSTEKHPHYRGYTILMVQAEDPQHRLKGKPLLALDAVQAGVGDRVLVIDEGGSARLILDDPSGVTIRTVVAGIVDQVEGGEP